MRFAVYEYQDRIGIAVGDGVRFHGLTAEHADYPGDLDQLLAREADLQAVGARLRSAPTLSLDEVRLLPPLRRPGKIICMGLNYRDHAAESELEIPAGPVAFAKLPSALVGHDAPIVELADAARTAKAAAAVWSLGLREFVIGIFDLRAGNTSESRSRMQAPLQATIRRALATSAVTRGSRAPAPGRR